MQFKEFATYINCALTKKGFVPSDSPQEANVAIILFYGISDPQEYQHTYSVPIWGQTGVSSSRTTGTLNTYGNHGTYSGTTTYTPTYGIKGSTTRTKTYTKYIRFFVLDAVDLDEYRKSEKEVQLWKTTVTSSGSGGDLRRIFPVLVAASQEYFGENTGQEIDIRMSDKDKRVVEIKGIATTDKQ
ncbi:conserved hypothetical protein [Desulfosudis oleivorans Hxd3]|uniref:Uncharacterized protein n=1 Tax=Desulfosudis oleivorans (strain DSM 6200 / JCM 39069 / Hxd3) TaxID=96561 RepID=A8ZWN3_DESOH|nr:conserved hypothetical protein [Desulfosudis oleivorans Hxd3]